MSPPDATERTQRFKPGELPLVLLAVLSAGPRSGYDLLSELARLFGPAYKPSPGGVYPALQALEKERLVKNEKRGPGYRITAQGAAALERRTEMLAAVEVRTGVRLRPDDGLEPLLERFVAAVRLHDGLLAPEVAQPILDKALRQLEMAAARRGA